MIRKSIMALAITLVTSAALAGPAGASDYELDPYFGTSGTSIPVDGDQVSSVAVDSTGRSLLGIYFFEPNRSSEVVRLNNDGSLDSSFGDQGVSYPQEFRDGYVLDTHVGKDGSILLAGGSGDIDSYNGARLVRLDANGKVDPSFRMAGRDSKGGPTFRAVTSLPNGKILVVGGRDEGYFKGRKPTALIERFNVDGSIDHSFGHRGKVLFRNYRNGLSTTLQNVSVAKNGKVFASGYMRGEPFVVKLKRNGTPDRSFGGDGSVRTLIGTDRSCEIATPCAYTSQAVDPRGNVYFMGTRLRQGHLWDQAVVLKLDVRGRLTKSFGRRGILEVAPFGSHVFPGGGMIRQPDGHLVIFGQSKGFAALRFDSNGNVDRKFGERGTWRDPRGIAATAGSVVDGGGLLIAGQAPHSKIAAARLVPAR